jgi:hypothetical protein
MHPPTYPCIPLQASSAAEAFEFGGSVSVELRSVGLSGSASLDISESTRRALEQTTIRVASDLPLTKTPINIDDVMLAIRDIPDAMARVNGGLGVPVEVTLTPICKWKGDVLALGTYVVCIYVCMYVSMHVCIYVCVYAVIGIIKCHVVCFD